jgi:hypothetical protein
MLVLIYLDSNIVIYLIEQSLSFWFGVDHHR